MTRPDPAILIRTLARKTLADQDRRPSADALIGEWIDTDQHLNVLPDDPLAFVWRDRQVLK